jgi:hypothetical protein
MFRSPRPSSNSGPAQGPETVGRYIVCHKTEFAMATLIRRLFSIATAHHQINAI